MALLVFLCSPRYCVDITYKSLNVGGVAPIMCQLGQLDGAAVATRLESNFRPAELPSGEKGHTPGYVDIGTANLKLQNQERKQTAGQPVLDKLRDHSHGTDVYNIICERACDNTHNVLQFGHQVPWSQREERR